MRFRISGDRNVEMAAGRHTNRPIEFHSRAADTLAAVHRLRGNGYPGVRVTDPTTGEEYDDASLRRVAEAEVIRRA
jgi:hypothetical protein